MYRKEKSKSGIVWMFALVLFVCVAVTTFAIIDTMAVYMPSDEGAISLISEDKSDTDGVLAGGTDSQTEADTETDKAETDTDTETETEDADTREEVTTEAVTTVGGNESAENVNQQATGEADTKPAKDPGVEFSDDKTVWGTDTKIELFKVSYENGERVITVKSDDGDKIIAPGTENTYTFKLKNTGNVALDYTVEIVAYCTPENIEIPITARICRYDGEWIAGGKEEYVSVEKLDDASDSATLGAGKFTYYTIDWQWLFESGNDELDTMLGSMANDEDVSFTVVIKTTATESDDPNGDDGITPPKTGDDSRLTLWIVLMIGSFIMLIFLLVTSKKEKSREESEEETLERK